MAKWEALVALLHQEVPELLVFSIGSQAGASHVSKTGDLRDIPMILLCQQMVHAKAVVGPSSGPMHLASFCGTPHVVWTTSEYRKAIKGTNKERYERIWNPLKTRCTVIDKWEWQPPIEAVYNAIKEFV
jgi:ADP-heptose:LPS heptosyltransferase